MDFLCSHLEWILPYLCTYDAGVLANTNKQIGNVVRNKWTRARVIEKSVTNAISLQQQQQQQQLILLQQKKPKQPPSERINYICLHWPGIQTIEFSGIHITEGVFQQMKSCLPNLRVLSLNNLTRSITDHLLEVICLNLTNLVSLNLFGARELEKLSGLENLTQLKTLCLALCSSVSTLAPLIKLKSKLQYLDLCCCYGLEAYDFKPFFNSFTKLKELDISGCSNFVDDNFINLLTNKCTELVSLNVSYTNITNISLDYIGKRLNLLESLYLKRCEKINDDGIRHLLPEEVKPASTTPTHATTIATTRSSSKKRKVSSSSEMDHINRSPSPISLSPPPPLYLPTTLNHHLRCLDISRAHGITDGVFKYIACMPNLEEFSIQGNDKITLKGLQHLSKLQNLKKIQIQHCFGLVMCQIEGTMQPSYLFDAEVFIATTILGASKNVQVCN